MVNVRGGIMKNMNNLLVTAAIFFVLFTGAAFGQKSEEELLKSAFTKSLVSNDLDGAIADCTAAINLDPNSAKAHFTRGAYRSQKGDLAGAVDDYSGAIKLDPTKANFFKARADAHAALGNSKSALADYDTALKLNPTDKFNDSVYLSRGRLRSSLKDYDGAIADYGKAIESNPLYFAAFERRAEAYRALGMTALAEADDKNAAEAKQKFLELTYKPK